MDEDLRRWAMRRAAMTCFALVLSTLAAWAQFPERRLETIRDTNVIKIAYRSDSRPFSFENPGTAGRLHDRSVQDGGRLAGAPARRQLDHRMGAGRDPDAFHGGC